MRAAGAMLAFAAALLGAAAAEAQQKPPSNGFDLTWVVAPTVAPEGERWIDEGDNVAETRLLPIGLFVAEAPVMAADGRTLMGAGQQIVRLRGDRLIACNVRAGQPETLSWYKRVCLIDSNGDNRFDGFFERGGTDTSSWLTIIDSDPRHVLPIAPAAFREIPPAEMTAPPVIRINYFAQYRRAGLLNFNLVVRERGVPHSWRVIVFDSGCDRGGNGGLCVGSTTPAQLRALGLVADILEVSGDRLRIRIAAPFERHEVRVVSGNAYATGTLEVVDGS